MPTALKSLDDRILGSRDRSASKDDPYPEEPRGGHSASDEQHDEERDDKPRRSAGDGARKALALVVKAVRLVLLLMALVVVLGIVFVLAPTNSDNVIVDNVLSLAETLAGPFGDVFTADSADRETVINYGLAAVVYVIAASLVRKLAPSTD